MCPIPLCFQAPSSTNSLGLVRQGPVHQRGRRLGEPNLIWFSARKFFVWKSDKKSMQNKS